MPRPSTVDLLAPELRSKLLDLLATPGVTHAQIAESVNVQAGAPVISRSAVGRYSAAMQRFSAKNRQAREMAQAYLEQIGPEGQQQVSELIVQQLRIMIYDLMVEIQGLQDDPEVDDPDRIMRAAELIGRVSRSVREAEHAADRSVERRRKLRQEVAREAAAAAAQESRRAGVSQETIDVLRQRILGVA